MERGLHFGNVSISLVLLLLLKALTGFGTSLTQGSAIGREPQSAARGSGSTSEDDGTGVMKRGLGNVGAPVIVADVTVEDDDNGSAGENDESYGESSGNFRPTRCVQVHTARCDMQAIEQDTYYRTISLVPRWKLVLHPVYNAEYLFVIPTSGHGGRVSADMWEKTSLRASSDGNRVISSRGGGREEREGKHRQGCMCSTWCSSYWCRWKFFWGSIDFESSDEDEDEDSSCFHRDALDVQSFVCYSGRFVRSSSHSCSDVHEVTWVCEQNQ